MSTGGPLILTKLKKKIQVLSSLFSIWSDLINLSFLIPFSIFTVLHSSLPFLTQPARPFVCERGRRRRFFPLISIWLKGKTMARRNLLETVQRFEDDSAREYMTEKKTNKVQNKVYCGKERKKKTLGEWKGQFKTFLEVQSNSSISHPHTRTGWYSQITTQYLYICSKTA